MISYHHNEDILEANAEILVNPVNKIGVTGKGLALKFKKRWPDMYASYRAFCINNGFGNEDIFIWIAHDDNSPGLKLIICLPTKNAYWEKSSYDLINNGLQSLKNFLIGHELNIVAIPALGCGFGELPWPVVDAMINDYFKDSRNITVMIYPPHDV